MMEYEYLFLSLSMMIGSAVLLLFTHKFLQRPSYECRYIYDKSVMLMTDNGEDLRKYDKRMFPHGDYLSDIESFTVKGE